MVGLFSLFLLNLKLMVSYVFCNNLIKFMNDYCEIIYLIHALFDSDMFCKDFKISFYVNIQEIGLALLNVVSFIFDDCKILFYIYFNYFQHYVGDTSILMKIHYFLFFIVKKFFF
jgi:hypothetical protein